MTEERCMTRGETDTMNKKILAATPASMREETTTKEIWDSIDEWMLSISRLEGIAGAYLYLNDIEEDRLNTITSEADAMGIDWDHDSYGYVIDDRTKKTRAYTGKKAKGYTGEEAYERFAVVRNKVLDYARANEYDYLLWVDSDALVRPDTALRLLDRVGGSVFGAAALLNITARWIYMESPRNIAASPGQWKYNVGNYINVVRQNACFSAFNGRDIFWDSVMDIELTGAVWLVDLEKVEGIRYHPHLSGEDVGFCRQIATRGGRMVLDTHRDLEAFHYQIPGLKQNAMDYLAGGPVNYMKPKETTIRVLFTLIRKVRARSCCGGKPRLESLRWVIATLSTTTGEVLKVSAPANSINKLKDREGAWDTTAGELGIDPSIISPYIKHGLEVKK